MRLIAFYAASFLSAFLLFQIQPMMAKAMLPGFGGSYLVWGTCMAFFQGLLIAGYGWAHVAQRKFNVRYAPWHWLLLLPPLLFLPFDFAKLAAPPPDTPLFFAVMLLLAISAGVPYFTLSTSSPLLQAWLAGSDLPQRDNPYVLYSASNIGSISALLTYPFVIEPVIELETQAKVWAVLYLVMLVTFGLCMPWKSKARAAAEEHAPASVRASSVARWFLLSLSGSAMLIAVTNVLTFDVASVPFLWVLPLCVYLLTFVLVFKKRPWIPESVNELFYWFAMTGVTIFLLVQFRWTLPVMAAVALQLAVLFMICMQCHGLLAKLKPEDSGNLTAYYFTMSIGGFMGTLIVSGLLPLVSTSVVEYPLSIVLACAATAWAMNVDGKAELLPARNKGFVGVVLVVVLLLVVGPFVLRALPGEGSRWSVGVLVLILGLMLASRKGKPLQTAVVLAVMIACVPFAEDVITHSSVVERLRNYYGIYRVYDNDGIRYLQHGTTLHGRQYLEGEKRHQSISYYHDTTPAGMVLSGNPLKFHHIGMIGLGTGALAIDFDKGDTFHVFELDPDNLPVAKEYFSYLDQAEAKGVKLEFTFGDGRVNLRDIPDGTFDLLIVDAFSSGSIPVHLLTREAIDEYLRVVKPDGLVFFHVSNRILDLVPIVHATVAEAGAYSQVSSNAGFVHPDAEETKWMTITRSKELDELLGKRYGFHKSRISPDQLPRPWTDKYTNLIAALF